MNTDLYLTYKDTPNSELIGKVFLSQYYRPAMDITATESIVYMKAYPDTVKGTGAVSATATITGGKLVVRNENDAQIFKDIVRAIPSYFKEHDPKEEVRQRKNSELEDMVKRINAMDISEAKKAQLRRNLVDDNEEIEAEIVSQPKVVSQPSTKVQKEKQEIKI